jgi:hypothetical protein
VDPAHCDEENDVCFGCVLDSECDDTNVCTTDACVDHVCVNTPVADDTPCLDADFCDGEETCQGGVCTDGDDPCVDPAHCDEENDVCFGCVLDSECDDTNVCTTDACVEHVCVNTPVADDTPCLDADFCNGEETCQSGTCTDGTDPCKDLAHCDEENEICYVCLVDAECESGEWCDGVEMCVDHVCYDAPPQDCADSDPCTADSCDEQLDQCVHEDVTAIDVTLHVQALTHAVTRDVTFIITDCPSTTVVRTESVEFDATGTGTVSLTGMNGTEEWIQATEGHTLSRLLAVSWEGPDYCSATVSFTGVNELKSGDFSNPPYVPQDDLVDITDFAILFINWNLSVDPNQGWLADATGDGNQETADFTAIQANFADVGDPEDGCGLGLLSVKPLWRIPVSRSGLADAELADMTGDGMIDVKDIRAFAKVYNLPLTPSFKAKLTRVEAELEAADATSFGSQMEAPRRR